MKTLEDYRFSPGRKLKVEGGTPIMVIELCAGMIRQGDATGGEETVAAVSLETGQARYWSADTVVEPFTP